MKTPKTWREACELLVNGVLFTEIDFSGLPKHEDTRSIICDYQPMSGQPKVKSVNRLFSLLDFSEFSAWIRVGMAQLFWWEAWAEYQEELSCKDLPHVNMSGERIEEIADDPDEKNRTTIIEHVNKLTELIEELNGKSLLTLVEDAAKADGITYHDEDYDIRFGECLAWMSMEAGVSWFDDHKRFPLDVPHREFGWCYLNFPDMADMEAL